MGGCLTRRRTRMPEGIYAAPVCHKNSVPSRSSSFDVTASARALPHRVPLGYGRTQALFAFIYGA